MRSFTVLICLSVFYSVYAENEDDGMEILKKCSKTDGSDVGLKRICQAFDTIMCRSLPSSNSIKNPIKIAQLVVDYFNFKLPENDEGFCALACLLRESGTIHDGKYDTELALESNKEVYSPESLAKANEIEKMCIKEVGIEVKEECDFAKKYLKCVVGEAKKANLKLQDDIKTK